VQHLLKQAQDSRSRWWIPRSASPPGLQPPPGHRQSLLAVAIMGDLGRRLGLSHWLPPASLPMLFVLGVLATALTTSLVPAILAAVLGFVGHNLLFTAPTSP
jgi:two-component system sensor histidine kinase KdpD